MKMTALLGVGGMALSAALLLPVSLIAQQRGENRERPRYKLLDLGTLGGPDSAETVEFPYINNEGLVVGFADTNLPDPFAPNCFTPQCVIAHAFQWKRGALTDLGTLAGGANSFAIWSNDRGEVVGQSQSDLIDPVLGGPQSIAVLWAKGKVIDLCTLGGTFSLAGSINDHGQIVGGALNSIPDHFPAPVFGAEFGTQMRAFLWERGTMHDLGTLGGTDAVANFVNQRGQVAGVSYTNTTINATTGLATQDGFLWENGIMRDIGTLGGTFTAVNAFNDRGQVAGLSNLSGDQTAHPFLSDDGYLIDLGTVGGTFGVATWLNNRGDVVGGATTINDAAFHAFFWRDGRMTDLGTIGGDTCSVVHFMNSRAQVVGTSGDCGGTFEKHGFLWQKGHHMIDLNEFVPSNSKLVITDGETINDRGEIAGSGLLPNGDFHAIVLVPCEDIHEHGCREATGTTSDSRGVGTPAPTLDKREVNGTSAYVTHVLQNNRFGMAPKVRAHR